MKPSDVRKVIRISFSKVNQASSQLGIGYGIWSVQTAANAMFENVCLKLFVLTDLFIRNRNR